MGIGPAALWFPGPHSIHRATPARDPFFFKCENYKFIYQASISNRKEKILNYPGLIPQSKLFLLEQQNIDTR